MPVVGAAGVFMGGAMTIPMEPAGKPDLFSS
jgi:hypothetical protein